MGRLEGILREVADRLARLRSQGAREESPIPLLSATALQPLIFQILQALASELKRRKGVECSSPGSIAIPEAG
ncbi:MAG: hypothetical protein ACUVQS_02250 [Candidatus Bipolaricaulaceae bacterium]